MRSLCTYSRCNENSRIYPLPSPSLFASFKTGKSRDLRSRMPASVHPRFVLACARPVTAWCLGDETRKRDEVGCFFSSSGSFDGTFVVPGM